MKKIVLKYDSVCADCGKKLPAGTEVRTYQSQDMKWKHYCLFHQKGQQDAKPRPVQPSQPPKAESPPQESMPTPLTDKDIEEFLMQAHNDIALHFDIDPGEITPDNQIVAMLFKAKLQAQEQRLSIEMSKRIQAMDERKLKAYGKTA